jgi:YidC/Oxa1 family membrane protein insertase
MSYIFNEFFYNPLYNGLILLLSWLPSPDVGVAVILFTALVKFFLFPLSRKAVSTQLKLREFEPELAALKVKYKDNREKQAQKMLALYRNNGINPFSGILLVIIQIPIIFALYFIFLKGGLPSIDTSLLYSFVAAAVERISDPINMDFFGFMDIGKPQWILAVLAGITQFAQVQFSLPKMEKVENPTFKDDMSRSINMQMRYILPIFITIIAWKLSGAVALYWITGNLFTIGQEIYLKRTMKKTQPIVPASKA